MVGGGREPKVDNTIGSVGNGSGTKVRRPDFRESEAEQDNVSGGRKIRREAHKERKKEAAAARVSIDQRRAYNVPRGGRMIFENAKRAGACTFKRNGAFERVGVDRRADSKETKGKKRMRERNRLQLRTNWHIPLFDGVGPPQYCAFSTKKSTRCTH